MELKKIQDKELVLVKGQENCSVKGLPVEYQTGHDCMTDCSAWGKPIYFKSSID